MLKKCESEVMTTTNQNRVLDSLKFIDINDGAHRKMKLTQHNTTARMTAPCNSMVGICNPRRKGDNMLIIKSVFLCLSFLGLLNYEPFHSIMMALFWQPFWLVVPFRDIANQLNAVARCFATSCDGFTTQRKGITE